MEFTTKIREKLFAIMMAIYYLLLFSCTKGDFDKNSAKEQIYTVDYYLPGNPAKDFAEWSNVINEMAVNNIQIAVRFIKIAWSDYSKKLITMTSAGEKIDVALTFTQILPYKTYMNKEIFADIAELLPADAPNLYKLYTAEQWDSLRVKGEIGAIPVLNGFNIGLRWNKQQVDKYGYTDQVSNIHELKDLTPILADFMKKSGRPGYVDATWWFLGAGYYVPLSTNRWSPWVVKADDPAMELLNLYEQPDIIENLRIVRDWRLKGYSITSDNITNFEGSNTTYVYPYWLVQPQVHKPDVPYNEYQPNLRNGGFVNFYSTVSSYPLVLQPDFYHSVMANSDNVRKTLQFMDFLLTNRKAQSTAQWGRKGVAWKEVNGFAELTDANDVQRHTWEFKLWGNPANILRTGSPANLAEQEQTALKQAIIPSIAQFSPNIDAIRTEIASIDTILEEYKGQLWEGLKDTDELLAEFQQRLNDAGYERVRAELQGQLAEFRAGE